MNNSNEDAIAARRRALAEALRTGEPVIVTASGEVEKQEDAQETGMNGIQVPDGKLAQGGLIWLITGIRVIRSYTRWRLLQ